MTNKLERDSIDVIAYAVHGKYGNFSIGELVRIVDEIADGRSSSSYAIPAELKQDIVWQVECFRRICTTWENKPIEFELLKEMNRVARGNLSEDTDLRETDYIADFGGEVPVKVTDLHRQVGELSKLLGALEKKIRSNSEQKIVLDALAHAFASIIRVHPFQDGNGRTARFLVQLVLRRCGFRYMVIPKFRNDANWADALRSAVDGDCVRMVEFFLQGKRKGLCGNGGK